MGAAASREARVREPLHGLVDEARPHPEADLCPVLAAVEDRDRVDVDVAEGGRGRPERPGLVAHLDLDGPEDQPGEALAGHHPGEAPDVVAGLGAPVVLDHQRDGAVVLPLGSAGRGDVDPARPERVPELREAPG
jgi:hypothetical protein